MVFWCLSAGAGTSGKAALSREKNNWALFNTVVLPPTSHFQWVKTYFTYQQQSSTEELNRVNDEKSHRKSISDKKEKDHMPEQMNNHLKLFNFMDLLFSHKSLRLRNQNKEAVQANMCKQASRDDYKQTGQIKAFYSCVIF